MNLSNTAGTHFDALPKPPAPFRIGDRGVFRLFGCALLAGLLACDGGNKPAPIDPNNTIGQSDFEGTPMAGNQFGGRGAVDATAGAAPPAAPGAVQPTAMPRLIEEGDIVKTEGTFLYVLNQYRGLQVIDLATPDQPKLVSRVPLYGTPLEMYVRGGNAYALVSDYWTYWRCGDCEGGAGSFHGSRLAVIDVSNPAAATLRKDIQVEGIVTDSRIVGDVLYVVSNRYAWWYWSGTDDTKDLTFVQSINIANPAAVAAVDRVDFPRDGWDNHVHVTDKLLYISASAYGRWGGQGECVDATRGGTSCSQVTAVDISSPAGDITVGATATISGTIRDRWAMDWFEGTFRVLVGENWNSANPPVLRTFRAGSATELTPLGKVTVVLPRPEAVTATRFDGTRAFVVTFERIDPLWTLDISDPANPTVAGHLETPGWLDYIEPRGDRLIALGHDRAKDSDPWSLQVSLYDVSNLAKPTMLSRQPFGEGWGWIPGQSDDYRKIFRVLDNLNLILIPFQAWVRNPDPNDWGGHYAGGVQLMDFSATAIVKRGLVEHAGSVERALPFGNRILTVSNELVQVVDAADRDKPVLTGSIELARNVTDIALAGNTAVELVGDSYRGDTKLYVVPPQDPNVTVPLAKIEIPAPYGRIFTAPGAAFVLSSNYQNAKTRLDAVAIGNNTATRQGTLELPFTIDYWYNFYAGGPGIGRGGIGVTDGGGALPPAAGVSARTSALTLGWGGGWGAGGGVTQVGATTMVLRTNRYYYDPCTEPAVPKRDDTGKVIPSCPAIPDADLYVVDLKDLAQPRVAAKIKLDNVGWLSGAGAEGQMLYFTHYEVTRKGQHGEPLAVKYFLDRFDLTNPGSPVRLPKINIPGTFVAAHGQHVFSVESRYETATNKPSTILYALFLGPDRAYLKSALTLPGYLGGLALDGTTASTVIDGELKLIDLKDPSAIRVASSTPIPGLKQKRGTQVYYDWAYVREAQAGYAFVANTQGFLAYDTRNIGAPLLERSIRTQGWVQQIRLGNGTAYLPSGYYGVDTVPLSH